MQSLEELEVTKQEQNQSRGTNLDYQIGTLIL